MTSTKRFASAFAGALLVATWFETPALAEDSDPPRDGIFMQQPQVQNTPPEGLAEVIDMLNQAAANENPVPFLFATAPGFHLARDAGGMVP
ncbi:MAG: hypothetical protein VXW22_02420, partial [Pseudomonadota bacterium]|nr:hypothetical protein [Pseudomonadota bacterium]